jgi:hypothetical protein
MAFDPAAQRFDRIAMSYRSGLAVDVAARRIGSRPQNDRFLGMEIAAKRDRIVAISTPNTISTIARRGWAPKAGPT